MKSRTERGACATPHADAPSAAMAMIVAGSGWSRTVLMVNSALASPPLAPAALRDVSARTSAQPSPRRPLRLRRFVTSQLEHRLSSNISLGSLPDDFAQDALGTEDQDEDENG